MTANYTKNHRVEFDLAQTTDTILPPMARRAVTIVVCLVGFALAVALISLPFSWRQLGNIEEWGILRFFNTYGPVFFVTADTPPPLASHQLRPLTVLPQAIAYILDPNSFLAWHVLQSVSLFAKACSFAYLTYWVRRSAGLALLGGLIFLFYPADTMQMSLRALHINWALALTMVACATCTLSLERRTLFGQATVAAASAVLFLAGSLMYEAGLFLAPVPLLLVWVRFGFVGSFEQLARHLPAVLLWVAGVGLAVGYLLVMSSNPNLYQVSGGSFSGTLATLVNNLPLAITTGLYRTVVHGWVDASAMLWANLGLWPYLLGMLVTVAGALFAIRESHTATKLQRFGNARWLVAGLLLAVFGYLPYLTSPLHILITQRTFLYAGFGGAMIVTAVVATAAVRSRYLAYGLAVILIALGLGAQWQQVRHYTDLSDRERMYLAGILEALPKPSKDRLVILDEAGGLSSTWMLRGEIVANALSYLYGKPMRVVTCMTSDLIESSFAVDEFGKPGHCSFPDKGITRTSGTSETTWLSDSFDLVTIAPDGTVKLGGVAANTPSEGSADRWRRILGCWPASACTYVSLTKTHNTYRFDFGHWWSLEDAQWGAGWRDAEWNPPRLQPQSFAWMNTERSNLWFDFTPDNANYRLRMRLVGAYSMPARQSVRLSVNGHPVELGDESEDIVHADIASAFLQSGLNELVFTAQPDNEYGLSIAVDWIELTPID